MKKMPRNIQSNPELQTAVKDSELFRELKISLVSKINRLCLIVPLCIMQNLITSFFSSKTIKVLTMELHLGLASPTKNNLLESRMSPGSRAAFGSTAPLP